MRKKNKTRKKMKLWEKIFIFTSIIIIIIICCIYLKRLIYYYNIEHPKDSGKNLIQEIVSTDLAYKDNGLYKTSDNNYFYKGNNLNNYVWYNGRTWRIVSINNENIKLITENSQTILAYGNADNYLESYVYNWLNVTNKDNTGIFLKSIADYETKLVETLWCIDSIDINNVTCNNKVNSFVGLLSVEEYLNAGGKDSYLNNGTYWWTSNQSLNKTMWYVFSEGGLNSNSNINDTYYSYGVRPVVAISNKNITYTGNGTKDNPYMIDTNNDILLSNKNIGEYIHYNDYLFRILDKSDDSVRLIMDSYLLKENNAYLAEYSSNLFNYLNNDFYNTFNKNELKECNFYTGNYGKDDNYNYLNIYTNSIKSFVGLPTIGELFVTDIDNYWLYNKYNNDLIYKISKNGLLADLANNTSYIRGIICLDNKLLISSGNGTKNNPYRLEMSK